MRRPFIRLKYFFVPKPHLEVDEELVFHLEQLTQSHIDSGVEPHEARRRAMLELGGLDSARALAHEERPTYLLETLIQDVR